MKIAKKIKFELTLKQLFWIISSVVISVLPHIPRLPIWFPLLVIGVAAITWFSKTKKIKPLPGWIVGFLTLFLFIAIIYFQGFSLNRELSVTILTTMTVLKLLETHSKRDAWMVVTLCYFVILTRFFYSQDLLLVLYLIVSLIVITHSLFVLQHKRQPQIFIFHEIKQTVSLLLTGIPLAALFFLFFPRLGSPIWGSPDLFGEGTTGISEEMSPGSIANLFNDDSTAFRATFKEKPPKNSELYWRGPVLWDFDGKTWSKNKTQNPIVRYGKFNEKGTKVQYEIELEPTGQKYLFALDYTYRKPFEAQLFPDSQLMLDHEINQLRHYTIVSTLKKYNDYELLSGENIERLKFNPQGFNPKTKQRMQQWKTQTTSTEQLIDKVLNWFKTDEFYYSYAPPPLQGNTVDQFLFETKSGFCEHYASAFTVMMRFAGVPARVVTGYQGGINNGEYLLIKQSDAHAWSEVWIKNKGWIRVDPTAAVSPFRVEFGSQALMKEKKRSWLDRSWYRRMGEKYDSIRHKWNKWVRDYDAKKQKALFQVFGFESRDGKSIAIVLGTAMIATTLFVFLFLYITRPKRKLNAYDKVYLKYIKLIDTNGIITKNHQGIQEISEMAINKYPQARSSINQFTELYLKLRFSKRTQLNTLLDKRLYKILETIRRDIKND